MKLLIILLGGITVYLFTRLFYVKKELKNITTQLNEYNEGLYNKKLDINFVDKDIESFADTINKTIDKLIAYRIKEKQAQDQLKSGIANISHDLRTPLTAMLGYVQLIKNKKLDKEKEKEYLEIIESRGRYLQELINEFFELSLIESPEYKLELEVVNVNNVLGDTISDYYESFIEKNLEPDIFIEEEMLKIIADKVAFKKIIENLISNILKYAEEKVEIKLYKKNDMAILEFSNKTSKLDEKERNLIFNKFYTVDKSRSNSSESTGIGLSIVKSLVEKMNGIIECEIKEENIMITCKFKC